MIEEMPDSIGRYQFTHALLQETLMDELSLTRRVRLHARIAESLEATYGEDSEAHAAELAFHFEQAQSMVGTDKLVRYSMLAGQKALDNSAFEDAMAHFQRGVEARQGQEMDDQLAELLVGYGRAGVSISDMVKTLKDYVPAMERAFDYYSSNGQTDRAVSVADFPHSTPVQMLMKETHRRALELVPEGSHQAARLLSLYGYSLGVGEGLDLTQSRDAFERALEIVRREGDGALEVRILSSYANILGFHLQLDEALPMALEAIHREEETNNPVDMLRALLWASNIYAYTGEFQQGETFADSMLSRAQSAGDLWWIGLATAAKMEAIASQGRLLEAVTLIKNADPRLGDNLQFQYRAVRILAQAGNLTDASDLVATITGGFGTLMSGGYNTIMAISSYLECSFDPGMTVDLVNKVNEWSSLRNIDINQHAELGLRYGLAVFVTLREDKILGQEQYSRISQLVRSGDVCAYGVSSQRVLGDLAKILEDNTRAEEHYQRSVKFCRGTGFKPELAWSLYEYADLLLTRDGDRDREKAGPMLDEALALTTDMGMKPLMEKVLSKREILKA